ncbi:MAG: hypothetical protein AAF662_11315 [Pseudomonadota bacterium]
MERRQRARAKDLELEQKKREAEIRSKQKQELDAATKKAIEHRRLELARARARNAQDRADLVRTHELENAKIKSKWKQHDRNVKSE